MVLWYQQVNLKLKSPSSREHRKMSRLIVKNIPKGIKEERLKTIFSSHGNITDCSLKYTKDGVFRQFAFIGFQSEEEARNAQKYFDKSYIDTSRIQVSLAAGFGDKEKPRAWSKYAKDSSAFKTLHQAEQEPKPRGDTQMLSKAEKKKKAKEERLKEMLGDLKDDPGFEEFLTIHQNVGVKSTWGNDAPATQQASGETSATVQMDIDEDSGHSSGESDQEMPAKLNSDEKNNKDKVIKEDNKEANRKGLSDFEYLKSKMASEELDDSSSSSSSDEEEESSPKGDYPSTHKSVNDSSSLSSDDDDHDDKEKASKKGKSEEKARTRTQVAGPVQKSVVKMRGFPGNVGEKAITEFFKPLTVKEVKVPKNAKRRPMGVAFIEFLTDKDLDQALRKNKNFIGGRRVFLNKIVQDVETPRTQKPRPWELKKSEDGEEEGIGESGRLYVRNLAYVCTEEQLEELFSKYGLLTEVNLPVDKITKKIKGFAHITFMIPENAVKAYTELDGTVFLGRMMHILPGKPKKEETEITESSSYKKQKAAKQKATAGSSHNWNALFLGANAVADIMAEKYSTSKSQILNVDTSQSLGVRMALGETQVVSETRDFLTENGVQLDCFSQPSAARSKTVILVKNLPVGTMPEELRDVFSKYGSVGRVVLPPSGITAVVEFLEPSEARTAFTKLAYTKFKHIPLYLEWAPVGALKPRQSAPTAMRTKGEDQNVNDKEVDESKTKSETGSDSEEEAAHQGNVLFVKNLNFETQEDGLRKMFEKCGPVKRVTVAKKKDMKNPGQFLSMGYGFVEYKTKAGAQQALKDLQYADLDGHQVALKVSNRATLQPEGPGRKKQKDVKQKSTKILVRNIPFEAKTREILELFKVFGELKSVRLPKKLGGTGRHRGFGFVDFLTKQDAKRAFNALCHSTHLYGRRLVLEWAEAEENIEDLRKKTAEHFHDDSPRKRLKKSEVLTALGE